MNEDDWQNIINDLIDRSDNREKLLESIVKKSDPIRNFPDSKNFLILARQWNSWYPSTLNVRGGCYFYNINKEIIIIDPGFNTLDVIKERELDIRLIRHIFVTHFHPDHFENLVSLITRLSSKVNRLFIYLNPTSYNQFKIYSRGFTEFIELKPSINIKLDFNSEQNDFQITVDVFAAYHKEIGGAMDSISLKFNLKNNEGKEFKIGFMSDTDGSEKYIDSYVKNFKDCQILIPHLGAIHKNPKGYNHLYKDGLELFLQRLETENKTIFLGEFGFELATEEDFKSVFLDLFPKKLTYNNLISIILIFFNDTDNIEKHPFIARILGSLFCSLLNDIKVISPNLEILYPFISYDNSVISKTESIFNKEKAIEIIKGDIKDFKNKFKESQLVEMWRKFYKTTIYFAERASNTIKVFETISENWNLSNLYDKFKKLINIFINYIPMSSKQLILRNFSLFAGNYPIERNIKSEQLINLINTNLDSYSSIFQGLGKTVEKFFDSIEMKGFIFLFYGYFMLILFQRSSFEMPFMEEKDGREIVCQYFRALSNHTILPVHPSYTIFFEKDIFIEGFTDSVNCSHKIKIPLSEINKNWKIIPKNNSQNYKKKEYIDIIPIEKCIECKKLKEEKYEKWSEEYSVFEDQIERILNNVERDIKEINQLILNSGDLFDIFFRIDHALNNSSQYKSSINPLSGIEHDILLGRIKELFDKDPSIFNLKMLIHPYFLRYENIRKYILNKIKELDKIQIKKLFIDSLESYFPYKSLEDEPVSPYYYELFDNLEIMNLIEDNIVKLDINDILNIIDFFVEKKLRDKNFSHRNSFIFFLKQFIETFFPLIENPENYIKEYKILDENKDTISKFSSLGIPLINYQKRILRNLKKI